MSSSVIRVLQKAQTVPTNANLTASLQVKALPSCAALLGKAEEEEDSSDLSEAAAVAPFEMSALKSKAFKQVGQSIQFNISLQDSNYVKSESKKCTTPKLDYQQKIYNFLSNKTNFLGT